MFGRYLTLCWVKKRKLLWISWLLCLTVIWLVFKYNLNWTFNKENTAEILALLQARSEWNGGTLWLVRTSYCGLYLLLWLDWPSNPWIHTSEFHRAANPECTARCARTLPAALSSVVGFWWGHICKILLSLYCHCIVRPHLQDSVVIVLSHTVELPSNCGERGRTTFAHLHMMECKMECRLCLQAFHIKWYCRTRPGI